MRLFFTGEIDVFVYVVSETGNVFLRSYGSEARSLWIRRTQTTKACLVAKKWVFGGNRESGGHLFLRNFVWWLYQLFLHLRTFLLTTKSTFFSITRTFFRNNFFLFIWRNHFLLIISDFYILWYFFCDLFCKFLLNIAFYNIFKFSIHLRGHRFIIKPVIFRYNLYIFLHRVSFFHNLFEFLISWAFD